MFYCVHFSNMEIRSMIFEHWELEHVSPNLSYSMTDITLLSTWLQCTVQVSQPTTCVALNYYSQSPAQ